VIVMLGGGLVVACAVIGLIFLRYWKATSDAFFLCFALAFWLQGGAYLYAGLTGHSDEHLPVAYLLRLAAFVLIVAAILRKNLQAAAPRE
jgi:hypothetical protein